MPKVNVPKARAKSPFFILRVCMIIDNILKTNAKLLLFFYFTMTIFAFLMLNTMSPAHEEIFGAKFSSYERLRLYCLYTVS